MSERRDKGKKSKRIRKEIRIADNERNKWRKKEIRLEKMGSNGR